MNESRRVAVSRQRDREQERQRQSVPSEVDEEGRKNDGGVDGRRGGRERRPDGPLALSQTVATGPETNLDQEPRERRGRTRTELLCSPPPFLCPRECPFFTPSFLYSSLPPRFVAPIINISPSPCLTARSSAHRCCRCFFLVLFFFFLRASPPPGSSGNVHRTPIINSNLCRTLFFILPSSHRPPCAIPCPSAFICK